MSSRAPFDLKPLREVVARAQREQMAPPAGQEVKAYEPVERYFSEEDWLALQAAVAAVRRLAGDTYNLYLSDQRVAATVVDALLGQVEEDFQPPELSFEQLVERLRERAGDEGPWLVATPLANFLAPAPYTRLGDDVGLMEPTQDPDWEPGFGPADPSAGELRRHLSDRMQPRPRFIRPNALAPHHLDTRVGACLVSIEAGTRAVALESARTRARYALAVWTLAHGPGSRRLWPTVGSWAPQPYILLGEEHKLHEPDVLIGRSSKQGGVRYHSLFYEPPSDVAELGWPFVAMKHAPERRSAGALLSATWALYQATHWPYELQLTDRMLYLQTAVASLCEAPEGGDNRAMYARWRALRTRLGLLQELAARGIEAADIEAAEQRLTDVRNIAAHGIDSVLINLGYPAERARRMNKKRARSGEELALAQLYSELHPMQWMVRQALQRTWSTVAAAGFSDELFESCFAEQSGVGPAS